ncbi:MAG: DNRLRE domain-containing protein [Terriglobales bacterium]
MRTFAPLLALGPDGTSLKLPEIALRRFGERVRFSPDGKSLIYMQGLLDLAAMKSCPITRLQSFATMRTFDIASDGKQIVFDHPDEELEDRVGSTVVIHIVLVDYRMTIWIPLQKQGLIVRRVVAAAMRNEKARSLRTRSAVLVLSAFCWLTSADAQLTPSADAYIDTASPSTNYGTSSVLDVESSQTTYIQFNLSSIPSGYTGADITKATLKLYVNAVTTAGNLNVDYVNGAWSENTIDASNAPPSGSTIAGVSLTTADTNKYILVDITSAVQAWLDGTEPSDGIALVGNSPLSASFDSKESTTTSHPAELDIVFSGGGGITGVLTSGGSGLMGGGTSGSLSLSLTNACTANQVLRWNGGAWVCAAVGTGTITGVVAGPGLAGGGVSGNVMLAVPNGGIANDMLQSSSLTVTAGTALTGGGTAVLGGSTTLNLDTTQVPLLNANNTFTGSQTLTGDALLANSSLTVAVPNDGTTGTTLNYLAKLIGGNAVVATTADTSGVIGVVAGGAGTTGNAQIAQVGQVNCAFDGATTAGDYAIPSATKGGACHDAGSPYPTSSQVIGRVLSTSGTSGNYPLLLSVGAQQK